MRRHPTSLRRLIGTSISLAALALPAGIEAAPVSQVGNPFSRLARIFDSKLANVEDRVKWLEAKVSTLAQHYEVPLKVGLGFRGCRSSHGAPDPSITLDLGRELPIDSIHLVPVQREFQEDSGIFPKRFTLELSSREDFAQRTILFTSGNIRQPTPNGTPVSFSSKGTARYVKLTIQEGHNKGTLDLFGLSEFVVISNSDPVSFGAKVTTTGGLDAAGIWYPDALTDGRTPLGIWQNLTRSHTDPGDAVMVSDELQLTEWTVPLDAKQPLDRVILFPFQVNRSFEASIFPESLEIHLDPDGSGAAECVYQWDNPLPGASHMTPLIIPLNGRIARSVTVTATRPWTMGDRKIHALSEIEVWSGGSNLAKGLAISRSSPGQVSEIRSLTDGFSSEKMIAPVGTWLQQLTERGSIERELQSLRSVHQRLASNSELNATWGSAIVLGLTFLIPVFIVERRRLMSREQLDQIRKRIASDLHDDIGSNLGSISLIARTARKDLARLKGPEEIDDDLGEVENIARESSLAMRDIVWLLERRQDSIGDLVQRMRETANRLLREINFTLECESSRTASKLSLDAKRHLFLFYKEAIHNVLKHSQANTVSIRLWDEDDKLALEILDNGIGIPNTTVDRPAAVNKLEDRAKVLDGLLHIASSSESGTRIRLLVKRSHLTHHPSLS